MRRVRWSSEADSDFKRYLAELREANPELAVEARSEFDATLDLLTRYPALGRPSLRWQAYREKSFRRWKKVIAYRATRDFIQVHVFFDSRQDLTRVRR